MPGSGKSLVVVVARERGYQIVTMGDIVREETKRRNLELTPGNVGEVMLSLRETEGPAAIANRTLPKIDAMRHKKILIDGIRSPEEVAEFRRHYPRFTLIAVHSSPQTRFERLFKRGRSDDTKNWKDFHERDTRELNIGLGSAIAKAETIIVNEGTRQEAKQKIRETLDSVERKWSK
jgi:dephospho-CoA kinase